MCFKQFIKQKQIAMGKGDIKTKRGKIHRGTTGVLRKAKKSNSIKPKEGVEKVKDLAEKEVKTPKVVAEKPKKAPKKEATPEIIVEETPTEATPVAETPIEETPKD